MSETYSYSAISTFENCPLAYKFRYVEKRPEAFTTIEARMGSVVHEVLHWAYGKHEIPAAISVSELEERFRNLWENLDWENIRIVREGRLRGEYFQAGLGMLIAFRERVMSRDDRISTHLEESFHLDLDKNTGFRGVVDRIARSPGGALQVIDYKTGRTVAPTDTLQLPAYALFAFQEFPELNRVDLCFEDLKQGITRSESLDRGELPGVQNRLLNAIEPLRAAVDFPPRPSGLCRWCGYEGQCPAMANRRTRKSDDAQAPQFDGACPQCGSPLMERTGKFGRFLGCTAFPECRYAINLEKGGSEPGKETPEHEICPECGSRLRERKGKFGTFIGCSGYPGCRYSRQAW